MSSIANRHTDLVDQVSDEKNPCGIGCCKRKLTPRQCPTREAITMLGRSSSAPARSRCINMGRNREAVATATTRTISSMGNSSSNRDSKRRKTRCRRQAVRKIDRAKAPPMRQSKMEDEGGCRHSSFFNPQKRCIYKVQESVSDTRRRSTGKIGRICIFTMSPSDDAGILSLQALHSCELI
jgi:hypothetical protein